MYVVMKSIIFWDVTVCSLVEGHRCFERTYCLNHQGEDYAK
jgi:hypothetical protein